MISDLTFWWKLLGAALIFGSGFAAGYHLGHARGWSAGRNSIWGRAKRKG